MKKRLALFAPVLMTLSFAAHFDCAAADPPVLANPQSQAGTNTWRLTWNSAPGNVYRLQRSHDLVNWTNVTTLSAAGPTASAQDALSPEARITFWRVILLSVGPDAQPPVVSIIQARLIRQNGETVLELLVRAEDNVGVVGVSYTEEGVQLGAATAGPNQAWTRIVPLDANNSNPRRFQAQAGDAAGNVGFSEVFTYVPMTLPSGFVAIGASGDALSQGLIGQRTDGGLTPFVYLPDNNGGGAPDTAAQLVFPEGGRVVETNGTKFIEYSSLRFRLGRGSALQVNAVAPAGAGGFVAASAGGAGGETDALAIDLPPGQTGQLPVGPLSVGQLEQAFGLPAGSGIPMKLFDRFPLTLLEGVFKEQGIEGAKWGLDKLGLPLPPFTGDWLGGVFDLLQGKCGKFPVYGEIPLDDVGGGLAKLKTTKEKPLVLELCPSGEVSLQGPATLEFTNGVRVTVTVTLDDPLYRLQIEAEKLTIPVAGALVLALPDNPQNCLPSGAADAELDVAEVCLNSFRRAYFRFTQAAVAARPNDAPSLNQTEPPTTVELVSAIADAWAASVFTPLVQALPVEQMRELARNLGRSASGASDFKTAADYLRQVVKLKEAVNRYAQVQQFGNDPALPALQQEIDAALDEATAAAISRSKDPEAISSLECMRAAVRTLAEIWATRQLLGQENEAGLQTAINEVITRYFNKLTASLHIQDNVFNHQQNPVVAGMNRFTALDHAVTLFQVVGDGAVMGIDFGQFPLLEEAERQIFGRAFEVVRQNLEQALAEDNAFAGMLALAELLDLLGEWAALGGADPGFSDLADATAYADQLGAVFERELLLPRGESTVFNSALRVRALLKIVQQIPASAQTLFGAIDRAHEELGSALNQSLPGVPANGSVPELFELLQAGAAYLRLGNQFAGLANTVNWEGQHLAAVVNRLGQLGENGALWTQLDEFVRFLMDEGDRLEADAVDASVAAARQASRKIYYQQAATLLSRQRAVAVALWNQTDMLRAQNPEFFAADAFFPGDLKVDKAFGSLTYQRTEKLLTGVIGGELRLPRINSFLTVENASINSRGEFDLRAFGQLTLPGGTNPAVVMTVEKKQPWHISWKQKDGLAISGKTRFQFQNGMFFEAGVNIADPLYFFELAAGTPELNTAETLAAILPLSLTEDDIRNLARASLWNDYYELLTACVETGYRENTDVPAPPPGSLPAFAGAVAADAYCLLDAWSCLMLAEAGRGQLARYQSSYEKVGLLLELVDAGLQNGTSGFESFFGANAEFETGYQLQRLKRMTLSYAKASRAIQKIAEANLLGSAPSIAPNRIQAHLENASVLWRTSRNKLGNNLAFLQSRERTSALAIAGLNLVASADLLGLNGGALLTLNEVLAFLPEAADAFAATAGLNRQNGQVNAALIGAFSYEQARSKLADYLDMEAELAEAGVNSTISLALLDALLTQMQQRALEGLGYNSGNGTFAPGNTSDVQAQLGLSRLVEVANTRAVAGLSGLTLPPGFPGAAQAFATRFVRAAQNLPRSRWQARKGYVTSLGQIDFLLELTGNTPIAEPGAFEQLLEAFRVMAGEGRGRLTADETALMRAVSGQLGNSELQSLYNQRLGMAGATLLALTGRAWTADEIALGAGVLEELLTLEALSRAHPNVALPSNQRPLALIPAAVNRFIAICATEQRANPLSQGAQALGDGIATEPPSQFRTMLEDERKKLLDAAGGIAGNYSQRIAGLSDEAKPNDFLLPESFKVTRVYGSLFYNRSNAFLKGTFGGRLELNTNQAFFEISQATLDSDGGFSIQASTEFPLQPAGSNVLINASVNVVGSTAGLSNFTGNGTMTIRESTNQAQTYNVTVSYDGVNTNKPLKFTAALDGAQNADSLRFSDNFVLFGGNIAAEFSLARAGDFSLAFGGKAGFFARTNPLAEPVTKEQFWVFVDVTRLGVRYETNSLIANFGGGSLTLAEDFFKFAEELPGGDLLPTDEPVTIPLSFMFCVGYDFTANKPIFSANEGGLAPVVFDLPPLAFGIPGVAGSQIKVSACSLEFFADNFPILRELDARFVFPMPGSTAGSSNRIVDVTLTGENWRVDGFPDAAAITLSNTVRVVDLDVFDLDLLGGTRMSFERLMAGGQLTTMFTLTGGVRGVFDADTLFDDENGGAFGFATAGSFSWDLVNYPTFVLDTVEFSGRLKLGGANGFALLGVDANGIPNTNANSLASVRLSGLHHLFQLTPDRTFEVNVSGALGSGEFVYFGLRDARFVFDGIATANNLEPQFQVASLGFREGEQLKLLGQELLPFRITAGSVTFRAPGVPLDQLFTPTNLLFTFSGVVDISLSKADANSSAPRLYGEVNNVQVGLPNGFSGVPQFSLNAFTLLLENLSIGDFAGLTGGLSVGNLNDPPNLYFAGTVGGGYNGVGIKAIVATRLDGLLGLCLAVVAGQAGIPLDGGSLGGILLTGAEGGVSFLNQFADPCDFKSFLGLNTDGTPPTNSAAAAAIFQAASAGGRDVSALQVLTWEQLARFQKLREQQKAMRNASSFGLRGQAQRDPALGASVEVGTFQAASASPKAPSSLRSAGAVQNTGADIPCPTGDCPPPTLNLLCQRHPSVGEALSPENYNGAYRDRVIFRFTSLDEATVDELLAAANIDLNVGTAVVAGQFADATRDFVNSLIPRPSAALTNQADINLFIDESLAAMRDLLAGAAQAGLDAAIGQGRTPLEALYEVAYAGVPCVDVTIQLKGIFTYTPISVALSATGGAVASTTGSAGLLGSVNLFGIPVGTAELFFSVTDTNGNPNPSLCGGLRIALGPLELEHLDLAIGCDDCVTGMLQAMSDFVAGLSGDILTDAAPILYKFVNDAAGVRVPGITNQPLTALFGPTDGPALLTQEEQVAVMSALLNLPTVASFLQANPQAVSEFNRDAIVALGERTLQLVLAIYNSSNPRLAACGEIAPKLFGFSLTGGNPIYSSRLYADKTNIRGDTAFSPSYQFFYLTFTLLSGGGGGSVVGVLAPSLDQATMGYSLPLPVVNEGTLRLFNTNPVEFAALQVNHVLQNTVMTFGYELNPFGFKLVDGEGRVALPTLADHPDNPARRAARPGDYQNGKFVAPTFPNRVAVLKAALDESVLGQATWAGRGGDLEGLFEPGSPEALAVAGRELARDYFPHGGFLGASKVQFPKVLSDPPPFEQFNLLFAESTDLFQRLTLAQDILNNYLLATREIGQLALYAPFPVPPQPFWEIPQGPQAFIDAIARTDLDTLLTQGLDLYPMEQVFMRGAVNAQILGVPVGEGELVADAAAGLFRLTAGVPTNSWLNNFVQSEVVFEIRSAEYILETDPATLPPDVTAADLTPEARFQAALAVLQAALQPGATPAQQQAAVAEAVARVTDTLPKVSLATSLNFQIPPELSELLRFNSGAGFFAYSPAFEPDYAKPGYIGTILFPDPDANNPGPYTLARRNGGVAAVGNFTFGFNLTDPDPNKRLLIDVPEIAMGVAGSSAPSIFPALSGRARVNEILLPGAFTFNGSSTPPFRFQKGVLQFNSNPANGQDYLNVAGVLTPIDLGPFLSVRPLPADANPGNLLGGTLRVTKTASGANMALSLNPASVNVPMLGDRLTGTIYGTNDARGRLTPFTFSTVPGEPWQATMQLSGALEIRSPLAPTGPVLFRAEPLRVNGTNVPFVVSMNGVGLEQFELRVTIPNGIVFTLFPGTAHESVFQTGANSATCLFVSSSGRVYFDSGTRTLDLNGLAEVEGRIELGFEPAAVVPVLGRGTLSGFSSALGRSHEQSLNVTNTQLNGGHLVVDARVNDPTNYSVLPNRLVLGPGEFAALKVRFTPRSASVPARSLILSNNSAIPQIIVPLTGQVPTQPRLHVNVRAIDFGLTPLGTTRSHAVRVSNLGDSNLVLTSIATAAPFTDNRTSLTISPGSSADILVSFTPVSTALASGLLTFNSNDPGAPSVQVTLNGQGSDRFWYRQRRGQGLEHLTTVTMNSDGRGLAAGLNGALLRAESSGRLWREDFLGTAPDLQSAVFANVSTGWVAGATGAVHRTANGGNSWVRQTNSVFNHSNYNWRAMTVRDRTNGFVAFAGGNPRDARIVTEDAPGGYNVAVVPSSADALSGIAFGTASTGIAVGENATILRSTDGGKTWAQITPPTGVANTTHLRAVAVNDASVSNYIVVGDGGLVLRTANAGLSWTIQSSPTTQHLHSVARAGTAFYAAGDQGVILRSTVSGVTWSLEDARTTADFRGLGARGAEVWAVTTQGDVFHRRTNAISGPLAVVSASDLDFGSIGFGERVVGEIRVANEGVTSLDAEVRSDSADFVVFPAALQRIPPGGEAIFAVQFERTSGTGFGANLDVTTSDASAASFRLQASVINRYDDFTPLPYAWLPGVVNGGALVAGDSAGLSVPIVNLGEAPLNLHALTIRTEHTNVTCTAFPRFSGALLPGQSSEISVTCAALQPGAYLARLEVASDARNGLATVDLVLDVVEAPQVVLFDSVPRGANLRVNGANVQAPAAFTIVNGAAGAGQLQYGSTVTILAAASLTVDGVPYGFQRWEPGGGDNFTFTAGSSASKFTSRYAQSQPIGPLVNDPPIVTSPCVFDPPADVAFGPWVKISQAKLTLPWLGDGATGSDFQVEGALFMSLTRAYGSLTSSRIRAVVPASSPAFSNVELLEVTPGSWNFDIEGGFFRLGALNPGLQVLNASTLPPGKLEFEADLRPGASNHVFARFATLDELPLAPGLLAMGPGTNEFRVSLNPAQPDLRLAFTGSLRALARPTGPSWIVNRPYSLVIDPALPTLSPLTFPSRTQLVDLALLRVHADAGSVIGPTFNGTTFSLVASNLLLEFFRGNEYLTSSASVASDGTFSFVVDFGPGLDAGPVRFVPHFESSGVLSVEANPLQSRLAVTVPKIWVYSDTSPTLWDDNTIAAPGFTFDSANFAVRIPVPAVDVEGFAFVGQTSADADNYFEVARQDNTTTVTLRNKQDLYIGAMQLGFTVSNTGTLSGHLSGRIGVENPPPLNQVNDRISMSYRSSPAPEFLMNRFFVGIGCRIKFGSALDPAAQACVLTPDSEKPIEQWAEALCFP